MADSTSTFTTTTFNPHNTTTTPDTSHIIRITTWYAPQIASPNDPAAEIAAIWTKKPVGSICLFQEVDFLCLFRFMKNYKMEATPDQDIKLTVNNTIFGVGNDNSHCLITWDVEAYTYVGHVQSNISATTRTVIGTPIVILQHRASKTNIKVASVLTFNHQEQIHFKSMCMEAIDIHSDIACVFGGGFDMTSDPMTWADGKGTPFTMKLVGDHQFVTARTAQPQPRSTWFLTNPKLEFIEEQVTFDLGSGITSGHGMVTMTAKLQ
jgi:hypothetical protein